MITARTALNYVERQKDGFLLQGLPKYGVGPELLDTSERLYPADTAFLALRETCDVAKLHEDALEIAVFQHLSQLCEKAGLSLQHFSDGTQMCGFIVRNGEEAKAAIQCAHDLALLKQRAPHCRGFSKPPRGREPSASFFSPSARIRTRGSKGSHHSSHNTAAKDGGSAVPLPARRQKHGGPAKGSLTGPREEKSSFLSNRSRKEGRRERSVTAYFASFA